VGWDAKSPPPKQGMWKQWSYDLDVKGWALRCGPMFYTDVRRVGAYGNYHAMLNSDPMGDDADPKMLMRVVDEEIIRRVGEMSAAYKILHARVKGR
jgi:hypothetical protein